LLEEVAVQEQERADRAERSAITIRITSEVANVLAEATVEKKNSSFNSEGNVGCNWRSSHSL